MPQLVLLLLRQIVIGFENGEIVLQRPATELLLPHLHLLAMPANHTTVVNGEGGIGNDQMFVNAHDFSKALAFRTGAHRRIE